MLKDYFSIYSWLGLSSETANTMNEYKLWVETFVVLQKIKLKIFYIISLYIFHHPWLSLLIYLCKNQHTRKKVISVIFTITWFRIYKLFPWIMNSWLLLTLQKTLWLLVLFFHLIPFCIRSLAAISVFTSFHLYFLV
jgi:hypothetical protein